MFNTSLLTVANGSCVLTSGNCVTSPNFPQPYSNYEDCWIVTAAGYISAQSFQVESHWDFLYVQSDRDSYFGEWFFGSSGPQGLRVSAGDLIHWTSDETVVKDGWEICIEEEPPVEPPTGSFSVDSGDCSIRYNCIVSPHYPDAYDDSSSCSIVVNKRGTISAMSFGTQLDVDVLYVDGNAFSGDDGPHVAVSTGDVLLWSADGTVAGTGWEICMEHRWGYAYEDWYYYEDPSNVMVTWGTCVETAENCVASPNYPREYGYNEYCWITTPAGYISTTSFQTERNFDFLYIESTWKRDRGTWYHGTDGPDGVEVFAGDLIRWYSDYSVGNAGWEICIGQDPPAEPPVGPLTVTTGSCIVRHNCVTSPGFPAEYDSSGCSIELNSRGSIGAMLFQTQLGADYLYVDGTPFSGDTGPQHMDVSQPASMEWSPDDTVSGAGWRICLFQSWGVHSDDWYYYDFWYHDHDHDDDSTTSAAGTATTTGVSSVAVTTTTTTTSYPFKCVGQIVLTTDERGEYMMCTHNIEIREAVVHGTSAASSVAVTTAQISTQVSPCVKVLISTASSKELTIAFEIGFDDGSLSDTLSSNIEANLDSFNSALADSLISSFEVDVTDLATSITDESVPPRASGVTGCGSGVLVLALLFSLSMCTS